jgi:hypothetical protein
MTQILLSLIIGFILGYNIREIREAILRVGVALNVKDGSAVVRGKEIIIAEGETAEKIGKIVKPIDPKEVARRQTSRFMKDFDL